ncbi:MAG: hypothetical protein V3V00_10120 [Saprospiraceae bacterium]
MTIFVTQPRALLLAIELKGIQPFYDDYKIEYYLFYLQVIDLLHFIFFSIYSYGYWPPKEIIILIIKHLQVILAYVVNNLKKNIG